jgi:hypothetical protein
MAAPAVIIFSLNILSAVVALLTSYFAYRANKVLDNSVLKAISIGFMLLGIGLVADAGTSLVSGRTLVESFAERILILFATFTYLAIQMVAYLVIAMGYALSAYGRRVERLAPIALAGSAALGLYSFSLLSYFVALILLAFVVFQGVLMRSRVKSGSVMVLLAFSLVLAAHVILLASVATLGSGLFLIGTSVQFLGFVSLLVFVVRSEIVGST